MDHNSKILKQCVSVFGWLERNFTEGVFQTPRTKKKMRTNKWRLCEKIKKGL
jgi:hypothetical protein